MGNKFLRFADAAFDVVSLFEGSGFRRDQPECDLLVSLGHEAKRLKASGAIAVIFKEIAVVIGASEQHFGNRLVTSGRDPGRAEIAAADMSRDRPVLRFCRER